MAPGRARRSYGGAACPPFPAGPSPGISTGSVSCSAKPALHVLPAVLPDQLQVVIVEEHAVKVRLRRRPRVPAVRGRVISKGGSTDWVHWQTGTALLLPRLLADRREGTVFLTARRPARPVATGDRCPVTGRARLSYRRAEESFELATRPLANPGAPREELQEAHGWTMHQLRHNLLTHQFSEDGTSTPMLLARSRHASVRSLERYARPGPEAVLPVTEYSCAAALGAKSTSARAPNEPAPSAERRPDTSRHGTAP